MNFEYVDDAPRAGKPGLEKHGEIYDAICAIPEGRVLRIPLNEGVAQGIAVKAWQIHIQKAARRGRVPAVRTWQSGGALYVARKDISDE